MRMSVHVYAPIGVTRATGFKSQKPQCISYFYKIKSKDYERGDTLNQQQGPDGFELCGSRQDEDQKEVLAGSHTVL